jgi:hypothetical protein
MQAPALAFPQFFPQFSHVAFPCSPPFSPPFPAFPRHQKKLGTRPSFSCAEGASPKVSGGSPMSGGSHRSGGSPFPGGSHRAGGSPCLVATYPSRRQGRR